MIPLFLSTEMVLRSSILVAGASLVNVGSTCDPLKNQFAFPPESKRSHVMKTRLHHCNTSVNIHYDKKNGGLCWRCAHAAITFFQS